MPRTRALVRLAAVPAAFTLLLGGCGGDDGSTGKAPGSADQRSDRTNGMEQKPATEILAATKAAALKATSVHYAGTINSSGKTISLDVDATATGDGKGTLKLDAATIDMVRSGDSVYLGGDDAFYSQVVGSLEAAKLLKGKYLQGKASDARWKSFADFSDSDAFLGQIFDESDPKISVGERKDINGTPAIALVDKGAQPGTLWVSLRGEPLPLLLEKPAGGKDTGSIAFSRWNEPVSVTPPPADKVVDPSKLGR